jgi:phosphate-selective porin OprO/OprP
MGYFLTGETQERRTILEPRRPFRLGPGGRPGGLGADLPLQHPGVRPRRLHRRPGRPQLWTTAPGTRTSGVNWYLNRYVKVYLDWQHTEFGDPVIFRRQPDQKQLTNELFWLRMQLYF